MQELDPWKDIDTDGYLFANAPMGQTWGNLHWLSLILCNNYTGRKSCLEIGTWHGAFSTFLGLIFPNATITADIRDQRSEHTKWLHHLLGVKFEQADCHKVDELRALVNKVVRPAFFFCDGGNKPKEFLLLAPMLQESDIIGVHDVGTEFNCADKKIAECIDMYQLIAIPMYEDEEGKLSYGVTETRSMYWMKK